MFERTITDTELETVLSKASALSAFFREIGPKYDKENTFAYPSIRAFKDSGLGAVPVPKHFGGLGGDLLIGSAGAGVLAGLGQDVVDDGGVLGHAGGGSDERRIGGGILRLILLDRVDVAGVGDDGGHAAQLFE